MIVVLSSQTLGLQKRFEVDRGSTIATLLQKAGMGPAGLVITVGSKQRGLDLELMDGDTVKVEPAGAMPAAPAAPAIPGPPSGGFNPPRRIVFPAPSSGGFGAPPPQPSSGGFGAGGGYGGGYGGGGNTPAPQPTGGGTFGAQGSAPDDDVDILTGQP